jgi:hypothetical protein
MRDKPTAQELREILPNISDDNLAINASDRKTGVAGNTRTYVLGAVAGKGGTITGRPSTGKGVESNSSNARLKMPYNKYHVSPKTDRTYNGIVYDSKKEMLFAQELDLRVRAGEITFWLRQVPFVVGYDPLTVYKADFVTFSTPGLGHYWVTVIEVKPKDKKAWAKGAARKLKLFRKKFPHLKLEIV